MAYQPPPYDPSSTTSHYTPSNASQPESSWHPLPSIYLNTPSRVTTLTFDPTQPLLWSGNASGSISSCFCNPREGLSSRYTSYRAHFGSVNDVMIDANGIMSVGGGGGGPAAAGKKGFIAGGNVKLANRRGVTLWNVQTEGTQPLTTFAYTPARSSEIVTTGPTADLHIINVNRGSIVRQQSSPQPIVHLRRSTQLVGSTSTGSLLLLDTRTSELSVSEQVLAHTGGITQMETEGNYIVTVGYTIRQGLPLPDPFLKLHDTRFLRPLSPIPFPTPPSLIKFHPRISANVIVASAEGRVQILDLREISKSSVFQIETPSFLSTLTVSPTGEGLALTDTEGYVHLWSLSSDSKFTRFENDSIELPDTIQPPERINWNEETPLNSIGMPYYTQPLLSLLPDSQLHLTPSPNHHRKNAIDPQVLASVKQVDFVGYAPYPAHLRNSIRRNQVGPIKNEAKKIGLDIPMFRSDRERAEMKKRRDGTGVRDEQVEKEREAEIQEEEIEIKKMPNHYRKVEIQYSRFGVEDFDFGFYNKTVYSGLETHITNSYTNSLLQALHYTPPVRMLAEAHTHTSCPKENCLLCEAGFLFRMLGDAKGMNCQASNFSRAFSASPQVTALGLIDRDSDTASTVAYASLIQTFSRYLLEQITAESLVPNEANPSLFKNGSESQEARAPPLAQLLRIEAKTISVCSQCGHSASRDTNFSIVDLLYPRRALSNELPPASDFSTIFRNSLHRETIARMSCQACRQTNHLRIRRILSSSTILPPVLIVNAGVRTADELEYWIDERRKTGERFLEPRFEIRRNGDGLSVESSPTPRKTVEGEGGVVYELKAMVVQIQAEGDSPHLVALARVSSEEETPGSSWHLFNDFLVRPISEQEALSFPSSWKIPAVLFYQRVDSTSLLDFSSLPLNGDPSILCEDITVSKNRDPSLIKHEPLKTSELPRRGTLISIDAEFVSLQQEEAEFHSDGTKKVLRPSRMTLARVSVLRGEGPETGIPFIDDHIHTSDTVVDYLTEFSGIRAGDLDPHSSRHTLVPLKVAYKKLRILVDLGCVFIGHGLNKDFRIINIYIPPEQIIDTVNIYHLSHRQRKLSLRFLAWAVLKLDIQSNTHDSIEDARTALQLYEEYYRLEAEGSWEEVLEEVYRDGKATNFKVPLQNASAQVSPTPAPAIMTSTGAVLGDGTGVSSPRLAPSGRVPFQ